MARASRVGDAPSRAERLKRVEELVSDALTRGLVVVDREAAPYIPPDDPRVVERVDGGSGWARYTLRLEDGTVYQEGGARRALFVPEDTARELVRAAAAQAVEQARTLHQMLTLYNRARYGGKGRTPVQAAVAEPALLGRLEERIRDRAPHETQRLDDVELVDSLRQVGANEAVIKRLVGDRTLSEEMRSTLQRWPERVDPAASIEAELDERLRSGDLALDETVVGPVRPSAAVGAEVVPGGERWWTFAVRTADGGLHLDGGSRRLRVVAPEVAERLIAERVDEILMLTDLRVLLHHRARVADQGEGSLLYRALAADSGLVERLDERVRSLAAGASFDPPLGGAALRALEAAGVDADTIRRLGHVLELPADQQAAVRERLRAAVTVEAGERLDALLRDRVAKGYAELRDDTAPYVGAFDPEVTERLPDGVAPWARHVVVLEDGSVHMEGGRTRVRLCPPGVAQKLIERRAAELMAEPDLLRLLSTAVRVRRDPSPGTAYGYLAASRRWAAVLDRVRALAGEQAFAGRIKRKDHIEILVEAGVDREGLRRLTGDAGPTVEQQQAAAARLRAARTQSPGRQLDELLKARQADGWVELHEDTVPYVHSTQEEVVEAFPPAAAPGMRHVVVLSDGSIHLEGGRTRVRLCEPARAMALLDARLSEVLAETDLHVLLDVATRVRTAVSGRSIYGHIRERWARHEALLARVRDQSHDPTWEGRVTRRDHQEVLAEAGVEPDIRRRLAGELGLTLEQERSRIERLRAARAKSPTDRLDELLATRHAEGWVEVYEDTAPFVAATSPEVAELLPAQAAPGMRHAVVLRDGSVHLEGGRTRVRLCEPRIVQKLLSARFEAVMTETDVFTLLDVGLRMRAGAPERTIFAFIARDPRRREALLARIREAASDPVFVGRITRPDHLALLADAGFDEAALRNLSGEMGLTLDQQREAMERLRAARATTPAERLTELLEDRRAAGFVELHEDTVPFVATTAPDVAEVFPTSAAPGMRHALVLRDGSVHLEGGRTRVRLCDPRRAKSLIAEACRTLLAEDDLFRLLEAASRVRRSPAENTVYRFIEKDPACREALLARIRQRAADPGYAGRISRKDHIEGLREAGVADTEMASLGRPGVATPEGAASKRPRARVKTPPADRLAELLADRSGPGWVELHEDAAPFLATDDPHIRERLPAKSAPWTRTVAVLDDDSLHLEGGRSRIRLCRAGVAERLLGQAARRILASDDLIELLDFELRCRAHPSKTTAHGFVVASSRLHEALLDRIRQVASDRRWDGRIRRRPHLEVLEELGVDSMRVLFLQGILHKVPDAASAGQGGDADNGGPAARARGRLDQLVEARHGQGWVTLPTEAVPYIAETDPRVREVFLAPDGNHRFAAVLDDGTIVHEGGTTRFWIVPPERAGDVLEERARYLLRTSNVYSLLDLFQSSRHLTPRSTPTERLFAGRPELQEALVERVREEVRARTLRFTRPDHLEALQLMGLSPSDPHRAAGR